MVPNRATHHIYVHFVSNENLFVLRLLPKDENSFKMNIVIHLFPVFLFQLEGCMILSFSFLIKAFVKPEKLIRFYNQAFIICKTEENLKILIEIFH